MPRFRLFAAVAPLALLSACASFNTYNKARVLPAPALQSAQVMFVDAKQRAIYAVPRDSARPHNGALAASQLRFCAEPSPDALTALALSASVSGSVQQKASVAAAIGVTESAANIGLRTNAIQLMRDSMFRLCEGYASGVLSSEQFETLMRRFQSSMVAILAIEQLTGTVRGPAVTLSGRAAVTGAEAIAETAKLLVAARVTRDEAVAARDAAVADAAKAADHADLKVDDPDALDGDAKARFDAANSAAGAAAANAKTAQAVVADRDTEVAGLAAALDAARRGDVLAVSTAASTVPEVSGPAAAAVADGVVRIVGKMLDLPFQREVCTTQGLLEIVGDASQVKSSFECKAYATESINLLKAQVRAINAPLDYIEACATRKQCLSDSQLTLLLGGGAPVGTDRDAPSQRPRSPLLNVVLPREVAGLTLDPVPAMTPAR